MSDPRGDEFVARIAQLQREMGASDGEVASALLGIVITICRRNGEDPQALMKWALLVDASTTFN